MNDGRYTLEQVGLKALEGILVLLDSEQSGPMGSNKAKTKAATSGEDIDEARVAHLRRLRWIHGRFWICIRWQKHIQRQCP